MYVVLRGQLPPASLALGGCNFEGNVWNNITSNAKDLLAKLTNPDPKTRITAAEALKHPWCVDAVPQTPLVAPTSVKRMRAVSTMDLHEG